MIKSRSSATSEGGQYASRSKRKLGETHSGCIEECIANRGCRSSHYFFPRTGGSFIQPLNDDGSNFRAFIESKYAIAVPVQARHVGCVESHFFLEHPACRLHQLSTDLVLDISRVHRQACIDCTIHMLCDDTARFLVHFDVRDRSSIGGQMRSDPDSTPRDNLLVGEFRSG